MKTYIIYCALFLTTTFFSQNSLSGIVYYETTLNKEKVNKQLEEKKKNPNNKKLLSLIRKSNSYDKPVKSTLIFVDGKGFFLVEDKLLSDNNNFGQQMAILRAGGSKKYYYDNQNKEYLIKECETLGECFIYDNKYFEWQLTQETKFINNYKVYKASRSNGKVIAWYTTEIPIGFGPKGEYGLPGLILELEIGKIIFKVKKIVLNPQKVVSVKKIKGGSRVTYEEYKEIVKKAKKSIFGN